MIKLFEPNELVNCKRVSEEYTSEVRSEENFFSVENCDDFFEILQGKLKQERTFDELNVLNIFADLPTCNKVAKHVNILGEYYSGLQHIKYYDQAPGVLEITKIHERFHAAHHLAKDQSGNIWDDFGSSSSFYKELLAQLFTYIYIREYNPALLQDFRSLNDSQPIIYQTFKMFRHFTKQEAEDLYWLIRNKNSGNSILKLLAEIEKDFTIIKPTAMQASRIIPTTKLRNLYQSLSALSFCRETQLNISKDLSRGDNYKKIIGFIEESNNQVEKMYDNSQESFLDNSLKRSGIPSIVTGIKKTIDVISILNRNNPNIVSNATYNFEYVNREINPLRTTKAVYDSGKKGSSSGGGGIDFIGWNIIKNSPILGEIKVKGDQNAFYALIQLLTYLSELATPNQILRINKYHLFGPNRILDADTKFYLYILLYKHPQSSQEILSLTINLANKIKNNLHQIGDIVFLEMDENGNNISVL